MKFDLNDPSSSDGAIIEMAPLDITIWRPMEEIKKLKPKHLRELSCQFEDLFKKFLKTLK